MANVKKFLSYCWYLFFPDHISFKYLMENCTRKQYLEEFLNTTICRKGCYWHLVGREIKDPSTYAARHRMDTQ